MTDNELLLAEACFIHTSPAAFDKTYPETYSCRACGSLWQTTLRDPGAHKPDCPAVQLYAYRR